MIDVNISNKTINITEDTNVKEFEKILSLLKDFKDYESYTITKNPKRDLNTYYPPKSDFDYLKPPFQITVLNSGPR